MALRVAVLALCVLAGGCVSAKKAPEAEQVFAYTDWDSFNSVLKSGKVLFVAGTDTRPEGKGVYSMLAVMFADACAPSMLSVTYDLETPAAKALVSQPAQGELRVDDLAPVKASYTYELGPGKTKVFVDFKEILADKAFVDQLVKGHFIRVKAVVEGRELSFRFTLKNHVEAVNRAMAQCKEEAAFKGTGGTRSAQPGTPASSGKKAPAGAGPIPGGSPGRSEDSGFFK